MSSAPSYPVLNRLQQARLSGHPMLAVLIDPDKVSSAELSERAARSEKAGANLFLVGGSLLQYDRLDFCIRRLKERRTLPVVLFPGNMFQVHREADALLFLSLISGRNPELLIGQQVAAAHLLRDRPLEVIGTGYMLVDGGRSTTASYISQTAPIPRDKPEIAATTALAGEMLGHSLIYLDAGSGAERPVPPEMIRRVRQAVEVPLIVGGGIRSAEQFRAAAEAGADMVVVGTAVEEGEEMDDWRMED